MAKKVMARAAAAASIDRRGLMLRDAPGRCVAYHPSGRGASRIIDMAGLA